MKNEQELGKQPGLLSYLTPGWLSDVTPATLRADLFAGFTSATVVLPQAVAFSAIAGLPPQYGLYTAIVVPVVAAAFGSSRLMVSGPTLVISALTFSSLSAVSSVGSPEYIANAVTLTLMVGVLQFAFGMIQLGKLVNFISHSVMLGFTASAAVLIGISQLKDALGVITPRGATVVDRIANLVGSAGLLNVTATIIAIATVITLVVARSISPKIPAFIIALVVGSGIGVALHAPERGVSMVGELPSLLPGAALPHLSFGSIRQLGEGAFAVALLGLLEALSIGRAFAQRSGDRFDANKEIMGQGLSNIVGSFFQCYAGSGSFTRSGVNQEAGARTPIAAITSSLFLIIILLCVSPLFAKIPVPAIAGIILYVAFKLVDFAAIRHIVTTSRTEALILSLTFLAGLFVNLEFSIYSGVICSLIIFLSRTAKPALPISAPDPSFPDRRFRNASIFGLAECPQVVFARLDGQLYFGSVDFLEMEFERIHRERADQKVLVLVLRGVGDIDLPGAELIIAECRRRRAIGGDLVLVARYRPLLDKLTRFGVVDAVGPSNVFESKGAAIEGMISRLDADICAGCQKRIFFDCPERSTAGRSLVNEGLQVTENTRVKGKRQVDSV